MPLVNPSLLDRLLARFFDVWSPPARWRAAKNELPVAVMIQASSLVTPHIVRNHVTLPERFRPQNVALSPNGDQLVVVGTESNRDVIAVVMLVASFALLLVPIEIIAAEFQLAPEMVQL